MTTQDTITIEQIAALRHESGLHGDTLQRDICDLALSGDVAARQECAEVIAAAEAMDDE